MSWSGNVAHPGIGIGERAGMVIVLAAACVAGGCAGQPTDGSLAIAEKPAHNQTGPAASQDVLDLRYPAGTRIVLARPGAGPREAQVVSKDLYTAGEVVASSDGKHLFFTGKAEAQGSWQIYEASLRGARPTQLTTIRGGAMNPALLPDGDLVFSSPIPKAGDVRSAQQPPALYRQTRGQKPQRLTFGVASAVDPTVLQDGRILFVSARPGAGGVCGALGLFTVNSDGTELRAFALDQDGLPYVRRPRETSDGQVVFLAGKDPELQQLRPETVRKARPFASRAALTSAIGGNYSALEPDGLSLLVCSSPVSGNARDNASFSVYRMDPAGKSAAELLFSDPEWDTVEATALTRRTAPMGHMSAIVKQKSTGTLLCLDANFTRHGSGMGSTNGPASRVRFHSVDSFRIRRELGEVTVQADGSFMVEVPADTALGIETLDRDGAVLQRLPPTLWVRPGENRSCLGCHEPYNRSPRNVRPLAVTAPLVALTNPLNTVSQTQ